jgi:hypothetical protein
VITFVRRTIAWPSVQISQASAARKTRNTYLARANAVRIAIIVLIIGRLSIAKHTHDTREPIWMPCIGITGAAERQRGQMLIRRVQRSRVYKETQALEFVCRHGTRRRREATCVTRADGPLFPNTGPGSARSVVSQMAIPSPYKWVEAPETCVRV